MLRQRKKPNILIWLFVIILIISSSYVDAKRSWSTSSRKTSGGYSTHRKPSSSSSNYGVTKPGTSHTSHTSHTSQGSSSNVAHPDPKLFSYPSSNTAPKTPTAAAPPIGWNVGHNQGPPPAYSGTNPLGGAKTNIHEKPPPYNPNYTPPQSNHATIGSGHIGNSGSSSPNSGSSSINRATPVQHNRGTNSTGSLGGGWHTPISSTQIHNNQQSSYPRQPNPVQTAPGQHMGGVNYQPGSQPAAGYYPPPPGFQQTGAFPSGGSYHQPGGSYYPPPGHYPPPAGLPPGGFFLAGNAPPPQGAIILHEPPKSSSGLGFGSGAVVGALGGAILGHALTPTQPRVIEHTSVNNNPGSSGTNDDKIIIINNGPPGSVTTQDVGSGTTVITTGQQPVPGAPSQAAVPASQPVPPQSQPMPPPSQPADSSAGAPLAPMQPVPSPTDNSAPLAPFASPQPPTQDQNMPPASAGNPPAEQQPQTGQYCVQVPVNDTNGKTVLQTYCYQYPLQPQAPATDAGVTGTTMAVPSTPVPDGMVPLAPMNHQSTPDLMKMPGGDDKISTAKLSENSMIKTASGAENQKVNKGFIYSTILIFLSAYYLH